MSPLAKPYATALFEVTEKAGKTGETLKVLLALVESLEKNQDIFDFFKSPLVSNEDKKVLLKKALGLLTMDELKNFFEILVENNRFTEFFDIVKVFETINSENSGFTKGFVDSAVELTNSEKSEVKKFIEDQLSCPVEFQFNVKPEVIGGIEARVGGYFFEDSVKCHIKKLNDFIVRRV